MGGWRRKQFTALGALFFCVSCAFASAQTVVAPTFEYFAPDFGATHVGKWMQYANAACGPSPHFRDVSASWSGTCSNGWLMGAGTLKVVVEYDDSLTLTGSFVDGHGEGPAQIRIETPYGDSTYDGLIHDGLPNGRGAFVDTGGMRIEGDYLYDAPQGTVDIAFIDGSHLIDGPLNYDTRATTIFRYADGTTIRTPHGVESGLYETVFPDGGRLVSQFDRKYTNDGAVYCSAAGRRIAGRYLPVRPDPALSPAPPQYPSISRRLEEEGTVEISFRIGEDATKTRVALHRSSGHPRLDDAALAAFANWRYLPASVADYQISMDAIIAVNFNLRPQAIAEEVPITVAPTKRMLGGLDHCPR
jgi:TonB family protein